MTEYDYSPEAYDRYLATQNRIAKWVDDAERHRPEFQTPFGPGGLQQQQPPAESSSSETTEPPPRHHDREEHHSSKHHDSASLHSDNFHDHEHQSGQGHASRSHPPTTGHSHHHHQYPPMQLQQQYASPHVQIYGAPGAVLHQQQPINTSYSYGGANSATYAYPSYIAPNSPPHFFSAGDSSHQSGKSKKSKRSHSHQPDAAAAAAAIAAYYSGPGYISPPAAHGYPPASGGRSGKGGYFVVQPSYYQPGPVQVIQGQYPPAVPIVYQTR